MRKPSETILALWRTLKPSWSLRSNGVSFSIVLLGLESVELIVGTGEERMDEDDVVYRKLVLERKERVRKPQRM